MNERIRELGRQAQIWCDQNIPGEFNEITGGYGHHWEEKFAALIVEECYQHCKDQLMDKKLAEEAGLDYNDGVMDCAIGLKQHFGVE